MAHVKLCEFRGHLEQATLSQDCTSPKREEAIMKRVSEHLYINVNGELFSTRSNKILKPTLGGEAKQSYIPKRTVRCNDYPERE
jgi:hypothetical protein